MKYLLSLRRRTSLLALAKAPILLAFDFDGTLAPIVADREDAHPRPSTRRLLVRLAGLAPCAVISGRSVADLRQRLAGVPVRYLVGNHGASARAVPRRRALRQAIEALRSGLAAVKGIDVEDAGLSIAVHYRHAPRPGIARRAIEAAVARVATGMRVVPGKMVVNLVPADLPDKGGALRRLMRAAPLASALYVGDDRTDEDVFRLGGESGIVGVRVGRTRHSAAPWFLRDQREIDDLLRLLVRARLPADGRDGPGSRAAATWPAI